MKVKEIYQKFYSEIPEETFNKICQGDPTSNFKDDKLVKIGRYVKWLTKLYLTENLLLEDIDKANEYLNILYGIRTHIKGIDIFKFDSLTSGETPLFEFISKYIKPNSLNNEEELLTNKYFIVNKEAEILYEDKKWLIVYPKTKDASGFYGANSQWCTRFPDNFNSYNGRGKLFIFILKDKVVNDIKNKKNSELDSKRRFQYHIQDNQFMNMADNSDISDTVIKLAYNLLKTEIQTYYTQEISFDTFYKIIKKKYNDIYFEDGYKVILNKNQHSLENSITSYLTRHSCDYSKFLETFINIDIEVRDKIFNRLTSYNDFLNANLDKSILLKYLLEYNFKDSKILPKLASHNHLDFDDINYIINTKNSSEEDISSILTSFAEYMSDFSCKIDIKPLFLKLVEKYSYIKDELLYYSLEEFVYRGTQLNENILDTLSNEINFLRENLKELLYANSFTHKIRRNIHDLLYYSHEFKYSNESNPYNFLKELLNYKLNIPIEKSELICNFKLLLDKHYMSHDSLYFHMIFAYVALIDKSDEEKEKIDNIIQTYYSEFYDIFQHMCFNLKKNVHPYHSGLMHQLHFYDRTLYDMFKNRKNGVDINTNINLEFHQKGNYFFSMM